MTARAAPVAFALGLLLLAGCGPARLNENHTFPLEPQNTRSFDLAAISQPQTVTVDFKSSAADVSVYVIKDAKEGDGLNEPPPKEKTLASKQGREGKFAAEVPANTATRVLVRGADKKTEVTLALTNSK